MRFILGYLEAILQKALISENAPFVSMILPRKTIVLLRLVELETLQNDHFAAELFLQKNA